MSRPRTALLGCRSLIALAGALSGCGRILGPGSLHDRAEEGGEIAEGEQDGTAQDTGEPHDSTSEAPADGSGSNSGSCAGAGSLHDRAEEGGEIAEGGGQDGTAQDTGEPHDSTSEAPADGSGSSSRSCAGAGGTTCSAGTGSESCCTSLEVTGGTYYRTYTNSGSGPTGEADLATISGFRLDKYLVTVGRFRQFVSAWNGGSGYTPPAGSGKHAHLNGGSGLNATGGGYEPGWVTYDNSNIAPTNTNLACSPYATWTNTAGSQENLPINCVNWWESYAFCIWDGGFLPSEAEWEYAAAGGSQQREYPWGTTAPGTANQYAIYGCYYPSGSGNCTGLGNIAPVGFAGSGAGLWGQLDLAGNMWEWNLDWYGTYVPCTDCADFTAPAQGAVPGGPESVGVAALLSGRVVRGDSFYNAASYLIPANRRNDPPSVRYYGIGLRCSRTP
jgi:formylglycine-generating enzyme